MIYFSIPYSVKKNIGNYYNNQMSRLKSDADFCLFIDGDATFTTVFWGHQLYEIINKYKEVSVFTACTNRVGCRWQIANNVDVDSNDIAYHRRFGEFIKNIYNVDCEDVTLKRPYLSGVCFMLQKRIWKKIGGFKPDGMLGIDNYFHKAVKKCGEKVYLMKGVYVYHWYRGGGANIYNTSHLK